ncbi:MAG: hypothetical protein ACLFTJ_08310 [Halothece sp.]
MVTVQVFSESTGKPLQGKRVSLRVDGPLGGSVGSEQRTNGSGEAHFDTEPKKGKVIVEGKEKYQGRLSGRMVVYL